MFDRFNKHLEVNDILVPEQFGFRKGTMIQKAIFTLPDNILTTLNQQQPVVGIFCDLSKTFVCVNHETLLGKLYCYKIHGGSIKWFESCLTNRKQRVNVISQHHHINFHQTGEQ
jgi:hypothetical protein